MGNAANALALVTVTRIETYSGVDPTTAVVGTDFDLAQYEGAIWIGYSLDYTTGYSTGSARVAFYHSDVAGGTYSLVFQGNQTIGNAPVTGIAKYDSSALKANLRVSLVGSGGTTPTVSGSVWVVGQKKAV